MDTGRGGGIFLEVCTHCGRHGRLILVRGGVQRAMTSEFFSATQLELILKELDFREVIYLNERETLRNHPTVQKFLDHYCPDGIPNDLADKIDSWNAAYRGATLMGSSDDPVRYFTSLPSHIHSFERHLPPEPVIHQWMFA